MKAFIISQPKAGTYLCANLLKNFGMIPTGWHVKGNKYRVYDITKPLPKFNSKAEIREHNKNNTVDAGSFINIINSIPNTGFAVGHLIPERKYINGLKDFKKILLLRPLDEHLESLQRFKKEMNGGTSVNRNAYTEIEKWRNEEDVFVLEFKDMIKPNYAKIRKLENFLFGDVIVDAKSAIDNALSAPSPTKSSIR